MYLSECICQNVYARMYADALCRHDLAALCDVTFLAVHPGLVYTGLYRLMPLVRYAPWIASILGRIFLKSVTEGIQTPLYCAVAPEAVKYSGRYLR